MVNKGYRLKIYEEKSEKLWKNRENLWIKDIGKSNVKREKRGVKREKRKS